MFVKDIVKIMEEIAPPQLAEKWDNVGLLVGDENAEVKKIIFGDLRGLQVLADLALKFTMI